jgi:hypothetical protein
MAKTTTTAETTPQMWGHSISERFSNTCALDGIIKGGFFLRKATQEHRFCFIAVGEPL